ncbi:hypothetical protein [Marvinbryantia formatexigens]|nr:hypothetical protein [Marvinbryantia formatexigens]SDG74072.1 hypothetical protein SAMN05660368_03177 [Marvinbryantia formatexigens]
MENCAILCIRRDRGGGNPAGSRRTVCPAAYMGEGMGKGDCMKVRKKTGVFLVLLFLLALVPAVTVNAGFRRVKVKENGAYRYYYRYYTSKTRYLKGSRTTDNAAAYKRWVFKNIKKNGKTYTYCFDENGYMQVGWKRLTTKACKGAWYWYYFDNSGRMLKSRTKNGHYLQSNGRMLTNDWHNGIYYGEDGSAVSGYRQDVKNGFRKTKKGVKYRQADGTYAQKKWVCIKDSLGKYNWYYFYSSGYMAKNTWVGSRHVDKNGRLDSLKKI